MITGTLFDYTQMKLQETAWRFKVAALAFVQAPTLKPIIKLENGAYIDLSNKKIVLPEDFHIHARGNLKLTSDKHVVIRSGRNSDPEREGYVHSIWVNADEDSLGRPLKKDIKPCANPKCNCKSKQE
jgi:hypothetical protein